MVMPVVPRREFLRILQRAAKEITPELTTTQILRKTTELAGQLMQAIMSEKSTYLSYIAIREGDNVTFVEEHNIPSIFTQLEKALSENATINLALRNKIILDDKGNEYVYRIGVVGALVADNKHIINVPDVSLNDDYINLNNNSGSQLSVPIKVEDGIFAVLNIEHSDKDMFGEDHEATLLTLASIVSGVITSQVKNQAVISLTNVIEEMTKPLSDDNAFQLNVLDVIAKQAYANAVLKGGGNGAFVHIGIVIDNYLVYASTHPETTIDKFGESNYLFIDLEHGIGSEGKLGISGFAIKEQRTINKTGTDLHEHDHYLEVTLERPVNSQISVPIGKPPIGVISIDHPSQGAFSKQDESRLEALAKIARQAIALSQKVTQLKSATEALTRMAKLPNTISKSAVLRIAREEAVKPFQKYNDDILEAIEKNIGKKLSLKTKSLYTSHIATVEGSFIVFHKDLNPEKDYEALIKIGYQKYNFRKPDKKRGIVGLVASTGDTEVVQNVKSDPNYFELRNTGSQISVPIIVNDSVYAVVSVEYDLIDGFEAQDRYMIEAIAAQASAMIGILEFEEERKKLEEHVQYSEDFIRLMKHGMKAPLSRLGDFLEQIKDAGKISLTNDKWLKSYQVAVIDRESHLRKIELFLSLTNHDVEGAERHVNLTKTNLAVLLNRIINELEPETSFYDISMEYFPSEEAIIAKIDESIIETAIINVVENAIKYHSKLDNKWIRIKLGIIEEFAIIIISDNGTGIPKNKRSRIFEKGVKGHENRNITSLGYGLYLAELLIHLNKGTIRLTESRTIDEGINTGTTFEIKLPLIN